MGFWGNLIGKRDPAERVAEQQAACARVLDDILARVRAGRAPTDQDLASAQSAFLSFYDALAARNGTESNLEFADDDRALFYAAALKMAAIDHPGHDAWPMKSGVRAKVLGPLRRRLSSNDPWLYLSAIQPALVERSPKIALHCYAQIERDPFLARLAVRWATESAMAFPEENDVASLEAFLAAVPKYEPWNPATPALPDARRWPLLASIYPFLCQDPRTQLEDPRPPHALASRLADDWDVVDRASAVSAIEDLWNGGHRESLARHLRSLDGGDPVARATSDARVRFVTENRDALERRGILAWDLCRAIAIARSAHALGWLSEPETWRLVLDAGRGLREAYASWDELAEAYVLGAEYFSPTEPTGHAAMVRWLQRSPSSPWRRVAFGA